MSNISFKKSNHFLFKTKGLQKKPLFYCCTITFSFCIVYPFRNFLRYIFNDPGNALSKTYTVDINSYELNALYEYYSVPKLDASAYLTAKVLDWQELNLLPGDANLFFEGTYLGNSFLDVINAGDTLNISLGKDKGVVIKRALIKEYSTRKFLGANKTDSRQYEIVVRNNKQQPVKIILEDQFPISTNKDIEIDKLSYENGKLDDDTKKVTWNLSVESRKEIKQQLGYIVKYPRDKILQLD